MICASCGGQSCLHLSQHQGMVDSRERQVVCEGLPRMSKPLARYSTSIMCTVARSAVWVFQMQVLWALSPGYA